MTRAHHTHPGAILRADVFEPLGLTITDIAERLGVSRVTLSRIVNERAGISPDLAIRLEKAGVSTARFWMALQSNYELAQALEVQKGKVKPLRDAQTFEDA
jgi:antitoxin HigA-1